MLTRFIYGLLIILQLFLFAYVNPAYAETNSVPRTATYSTTQTSLYEEISWVQKTEYIVLGLMHVSSCAAGGASIIGLQCPFLGTAKTNNEVDYINLSGGALETVSNLIATMVLVPPVHAPEYLRTVAENFNLVKPAYAQVGGTGSQVIGLVLTLWQVSRNITYIAMIAIFLMVGLMVMFRSKINPQTVITIQAALPGLVLGLILITFSYFIASVLVDIGFLATWLIGFYFLQTQPPGALNPVGDILRDHNVLSLMSFFANAGDHTIIERNIGPLISNLSGSAAQAFHTMLFFLGCQYTTQIGTPIAAASAALSGIPIVSGIVTATACVTGGELAANNPGFVVGWIVFFIFLFIILYSMFRLLLKLINNYVMILLLTFTGPFNFLVASLPGRQGVAIDWTRNMLCNVLAFPAVFAAFYFIAYILGPDPSNASAVATPFNVTHGVSFGTQSMPLFGALDINFIRYLVAFGVIVATPALPDAVCEVVGKVGRVGQIIGGETERNVSGGQGHFGKTAGAIQGSAGALAGAKWKGVGPTSVKII